MMLLTRPISLAAAALILALGLGACGDQDGDGASQSAKEAAEGATDKVKDPAGAEAESTDRVDIVEFAYEPEAIRIKAGTEVRWTNKDSFDHTVTADDRSFDSKAFKNDDPPYTHKFDTPGTFKYFCDIHNYMTGSVVVE